MNNRQRIGLAIVLLVISAILIASVPDESVRVLLAGLVAAGIVLLVLEVP